eukprot:TRINITY_DN1196_c0_g1_i1.p1 TRINITY_DN1196_c0_g1~~TRINITY_DN1196_c0_g1_i1.p1  ORF type:complete len:793 (+),score=169.99 TRINITY_DN1196_c0_g1_i1:75-2453(+)
MGISGLLPFLKNATRPVHVRELKGKTAAIDVYCWLHKGAFGCAEQLVQGKPTDAYIKYVMKYIDMLLYHDIKPILVFDGRNLPSKADTEKKRRENRKANREKAVKLLSEGKAKEARDYFQRCVDITPQMARDVIKASRERNIDCIVAPYEADAQLAFLSTCLADFIITEDSDLTLFGCDKIVFKLNLVGDGTLYEKTRLNEVFGNLAPQFDFDKFRKMCIMSGCDYLPSLQGIGLAKAKQFWSKISNPNIKAVLPKIPHYLKLPSITVGQGYIEGFIQANNTFLYQVVFDPVTRKERPLTSYDGDVDPDELSYCGHLSDDHTALQLALGNMDLHSLRQVNHFDPDRMVLEKSAKYGSVAKHMSIWSKGYTKEKSHTTAKPNINQVLMSSNSKSKQVTVNTSFSTCADPLKMTRIVNEKRKVEAMTSEAVEEMLCKDDTSEKNSSPVKKKIKLESSEEKKSQIDTKFTRILGDNKLEVKNTTVSRYFGGTKVIAEKVSEAGTWFDSINTSAKTADTFIYDTDKISTSIRNTDTDQMIKQQEEDQTEKENVKAKSNCDGKMSEEERRQMIRNPFAKKKSLFDGKDESRSPSDVKKTDNEDNSIDVNTDVTISNTVGTSAEKSPRDSTNNTKFGFLKEFQRPTSKAKLADFSADKERKASHLLSSSPPQLFFKRKAGSQGQSSITNPTNEESSNRKSSHSDQDDKSEEEETSPIINSSKSFFHQNFSSPRPPPSMGTKSTSTSAPSRVSSAIMKSAVRPSGLTKGGGKKSAGVKVDKNQPKMTEMFAFTAKRADI